MVIGVFVVVLVICWSVLHFGATVLFRLTCFELPEIISSTKIIKQNEYEWSKGAYKYVSELIPFRLLY